jgi:hypothetical protein
MPSDDDLSIGELVDHITVDAYGDEGYWSFLQAFDDHLNYPLAPPSSACRHASPRSISTVTSGEASLPSSPVTPTSTLSLLDVELDDGEVDAKRLLAAYRQWLGIA